MRSLEQIDQAIDANRRALMARVRCNPGCSAHTWQNAWDRCPDLHAKEHALYLERYDAQCARDTAERKAAETAQRKERAAARKATKQSQHDLAVAFVKRHDQLCAACSQAGA